MKRSPKFHIRRDRAKEWRYRFVAGNGQIMAGPEEGYTRKAACLKAIARMKEEVVAAEIVEDSELDEYKPRKIPVLADSFRAIDRAVRQERGRGQERVSRARG